MDAIKRKKVRRVEKAITRLSKMNLVYKLGGGRTWGGNGTITEPTGPGTGWTDCSGFALYLMMVAGLKPEVPNGWTGTLVQEGSEGTSPYFTLFLKEPDKTEGHVIIRLRKRPRWWHLGVPKYRWAECGGRDNPKAGGGPTWFRPTESRIAEFPFKRHFKAL